MWVGEAEWSKVQNSTALLDLWGLILSNGKDSHKTDKAWVRPNHSYTIQGTLSQEKDKNKATKTNPQENLIFNSSHGNLILTL